MMKKTTPECSYGPYVKVQAYSGTFAAETTAAANQRFLRLILDKVPGIIGGLNAKRSLNLSARTPTKTHLLQARYGFDKVHQHIHVEVLLGISHRALVAWKDRVYSFGHGDVLVLHPNQLHCDAFESPSTPYDMLWYGLRDGNLSVHLVSYVAKGARRGFHRIGNLIFPLKTETSIAEMLCDKNLSLDSLKETLLYLTWRAVSAARHRGEQSGHPLVTEAIEIMTEEFANPLSVANVAHRLEITPNYLSMLFMREKGISFTRYLQRIRLAQAQSLLENPHLQIKAIARSCGFQSSYYFTRPFKQAFGVTPREYRRDASLFFV